MRFLNFLFLQPNVVQSWIIQIMIPSLNCRNRRRGTGWNRGVKQVLVDYWIYKLIWTLLPEVFRKVGDWKYSGSWSPCRLCLVYLNRWSSEGGLFLFLTFVQLFRFYLIIFLTVNLELTW
jgi:hypothetical protein